MGIYEKYKGSGIYYIKYPYSKDPSTDKIRYKIEKVGPKKLAERFFNKKMTEWAEKKFYGRDYDISFSDLVDWYLARNEVKSKKSFQKDKQHCATLKKTLGNHMAYDIKNHMVREFRDKLRRTKSKSGSLYANSTINRILQVGRHMYNLGLDNGILFCPNPFKGALLPERNSRERILSWKEFLGLVSNSPLHLAKIIQVGYYTGMRVGEILGLTWNRVNLKEGFISLEAEDTKTEYPRVIYSNQVVREILEGLNKIRCIDHNYVFTYKNKPIKSIKTAFKTACLKAGIKNLWFHDLRHTFNTNLRKAGAERSVIMKLTGHKTMAMFLRYNTVDKDDAKDAMEKLDRFLEHENCSYSAPERIKRKK